MLYIWLLWLKLGCYFLMVCSLLCECCLLWVSRGSVVRSCSYNCDGCKNNASMQLSIVMISPFWYMTFAVCAVSYSLGRKLGMRMAIRSIADPLCAPPFATMSIVPTLWTQSHWKRRGHARRLVVLRVCATPYCIARAFRMGRNRFVGFRLLP